MVTLAQNPNKIECWCLKTCLSINKNKISDTGLNGVTKKLRGLALMFISSQWLYFIF